MKPPGWLPNIGDLYNVGGLGPVLVTGVKEEGQDDFNAFWDRPYGKRWIMSYVGPEGPAEMKIDNSSYLDMRYMGSATQ
jgi:hypothetical protein